MLRLSKRVGVSHKEKIAIRLLAVLGALVLASIFLVFLGHQPLEIYMAMIKGAFGSAYRTRETIIKGIPLIITSLGIMIAFRMKFWNIGAEGQILMGAFGASFVALKLTELPSFIMIPAMILAALLCGGMWALIPAYLKVKFETNETIITLMLNYVAIKWITYLQYGPWKDPNALGFPKIPNFVENALLPKVFGIHIGWIIALILVVLVYIFLHYSKPGFEINVVGESKETAKYAGMSVKRITIGSLMLSGAICGLAGMIEATGVNGTLSVSLSAGYGYTAIITAWLSGLKAIIIVPVSLLFALLLQGGSFIQSAYGISGSSAEILQSLILFFVLASEFFIEYRIHFGQKQVAKGGEVKC